jgi:hypothetical protein
MESTGICCGVMKGGFVLGSFYNMKEIGCFVQGFAAYVNYFGNPK